MIRTYRELKNLETFEERYRYLALRGEVGYSTFGYDRYMNQQFYKSSEWLKVRQWVILRDEGCDLGIRGRDIFSRIIIHHMNAMTVDDLKQGRSDVLDPDFLISTTHNTHNAIHYGDESRLTRHFVPRRRGDTKLW
jgi:hypothetical protein